MISHKALFICNPCIENATQPNTNLPENVLTKPKTKQLRRFHFCRLRLKYAGTRGEFRLSSYCRKLCVYVRGIYQAVVVLMMLQFPLIVCGWNVARLIAFGSTEALLRLTPRKYGCQRC